MIEKIFKLKENGTDVKTEFLAGSVTFFAMSYILFVGPNMLQKTGMPFQAVFLAIIIASMVGTLIMAFVANVPYAQAPGVGLMAFFTFTVCQSLGYTWQQALSMVFICGIINIIITITKVRKMIIQAIPPVMRQAIAGGIGIFVCYIGLKNAGFLQFTSDNMSITASKIVNGQVVNLVSNGGVTPNLTRFNHIGVVVALLGVVITLILLVKKVKGSILLGIITTTIISIVVGIVNFKNINFEPYSLHNTLAELQNVVGVIFTDKGLYSLFKDINHLPQVIMTILAFSLSDIFDTIGTFIGADRNAGIFSKTEQNAAANGRGLQTKLDKALFSDAIATTVGSVLGTSNVTTYVESAAGIASGGRTGLTALVVACYFGLSIVLAPIIALVPTEAVAPALIVVGIMMMSAFKGIKWNELEEAIPAFFTSIFMGLCYSISYGIAIGFIFYCLIKIVKKKAFEVKPILWIVVILFIINFVVQAIFV